MAYFDNAATTYPKPECVYSFMDDFYRHHGGSAGRDHSEIFRVFAGNSGSNGSRGSGSRGSGGNGGGDTIDH